MHNVKKRMEKCGKYGNIRGKWLTFLFDPTSITAPEIPSVSQCFAEELGSGSNASKSAFW
jgi:hypothetical protein